MPTYQERDPELVKQLKELLGQPETPEEIDAYLRAAGYDPAEVGARMQSAAEKALKLGNTGYPTRR